MVSGNRGKDVKHVPALRVLQTEKAAGAGSSDLYGDLAPDTGHSSQLFSGADCGNPRNMSRLSTAVRSARPYSALIQFPETDGQLNSLLPNDFGVDIKHVHACI